MTIGVLPIAGRLLTDSLIFHCYCSNYFTYKNYFSKKIKFLVITPYHFPRRPVTLSLCIMLVVLTALSYSDLAKSWRGECGGIGIRP